MMTTDMTQMMHNFTSSRRSQAIACALDTAPMGCQTSRVSTESPAYHRQLHREQRARWKRWLRVQLPYQLNLLSMRPGYMLDIGCGLGRNLRHNRGRGVGIDHNPQFVDACRADGLTAYTPDAFETSPHAHPQTFDSILLSHVLEHMGREEQRALILRYLPYLKTKGAVIIITPQEWGYRADPTHVELVDFESVRHLATDVGLHVRRQYSFPFPRHFGPYFRFNEFVTLLGT